MLAGLKPMPPPMRSFLDEVAPCLHASSAWSGSEANDFFFGG
jgi:hypothetical protein